MPQSHAPLLRLNGCSHVLLSSLIHVSLLYLTLLPHLSLLCLALEPRAHASSGAAFSVVMNAGPWQMDWIALLHGLS